MSKDLSSYRLPAFWRDASVVWGTLPASWFGVPRRHGELLVFEAIGGVRNPGPADVAASHSRFVNDVDIGSATLCWADATSREPGGDGEADPVLAPVLRRLIAAYGSAAALRSAALAFVDARLASAGADPALLARFIVERDELAARVAARRGDGAATEPGHGDDAHAGRQRTHRTAASAPPRHASAGTEQTAGARPPIPDDHETRPRNAAEIMVVLRDQLGLPLADIIDLDLQALHDLMTVNVGPEDLETAEMLVIVDDDTLEELDRVVTAEIARARPDRRVEEGYHGWTSRSRAAAEQGIALGTALTDIEALLASANGTDEIVLEDEDYARVRREMNRTISSRPHGRSARVGGVAPDEEALARARDFTEARVGLARPAPREGRGPGFDVVAANRFVLATATAMRRGRPPRGTSNERSVRFGSALAGEETRLLQLALHDGSDLICLAFEPGAEDRGPSNIAVYEVRDGQLNAWTECDPLVAGPGSALLLRSRIRDVCFSYDGRALVAIAGRPRRNVKADVARGHAAIRRIAAKLP